MKQFVLASLLAASLAACVTPLTYGPATAPNAAGFSDMRIEGDRYRVVFRGSPDAPPGQIHDFALLRAAEVTLANGADWFRIVNRSEDYMPGRGPQVSLGTGGYDYGRSSAVGVGVSTGFYLGGGPKRSVALEIIVGRGETPSDRDVYDARSVAQSLGPRVAPRPNAY